MHGPRLAFSDHIHATKYRGEGESFREAMNRIASALSDGAEHYGALREILLDMRFLPAGRVQAAVGSTRWITPYNCFVSGPIQDTFKGDGTWAEDTGSIMRRAWEAAATMRMGGGIGYDFSTLRPRGALINGLGSMSNGPLAFAEIYDAICRCTASAGHRRGAQMGVMRIDHPDIEEFIHSKQNDTRLQGFNLSIGVTDEFMFCVREGGEFALRFGGREHRKVNARQLWEMVMRSTWDWAEPGVLFIDTINKRNNLWYCEKIAATNPCGEQPLPPFGACLLGSFNLVRYLKPGSDRPFVFDAIQFRKDIPVIVRAMDNVINSAVYPLPEQRDEAVSKRRMGLGVTGLANTLEAMGHPYGGGEFVALTRSILAILRDVSYEASSDLAVEKGSFSMYDADPYCRGWFIKNLPGWLQEKIRRQGMRNSHLTSIAPTGTISLAADNVSSGLEPVFAYAFGRTVIEFDGPRQETVEDYGVRVLGVKGRRASEVTVEQHVAVLNAAACLVDSAVSKTCNVPADTDWERFKGIYTAAWEGGAKGCTTYQVGGKRGAVLVEKPREEPAEGGACRIDPETGARTCE